MAELPPPPPPAQRPQLTPACYSRILGMGADNQTSQDSRPNSEILFSTPFPTSEVGYTRPYGSFGVAPQNVIPMPLPPYQAQIQQGGTGVFHPARETTENRRANYKYNNIRERRMKQVGGREDNDNGSKEKKEKKKWNKKKNGGSEKKKKEEECNVPNLPPGIVLPMEWPYPDSF